MDPTWLASLFGPGALDTSQFTGGLTEPSFSDRFSNNLPFAAPTPGVQVPPQPVPSAAPTAPTDAGVPNPPAMPPAVAPVAVPPGLQNNAATGPNADRILSTLRGIQAPPPPQYQKVSTPHPPQTHAISPANLAALFAGLGISPQQLPQLRRG